MSFAYYENEIIVWATKRGIIDNSTAEMQFLKGTSEWGELSDALAKKDMHAVKDAVGDVMVCLINMCAMLDINVVQCMEQAYGEIKDRKGKMMPGGVFVKEQDNVFKEAA